MAKIRVILPYRRGELTFEVGQVVDVSERQALFYLADAPGCFERVVEPPDGPMVDKMMKAEIRKGGK